MAKKKRAAPPQPEPEAPATPPVKRSRGRAPTQSRQLIDIQDAADRLALSTKEMQRQMDDGMPHERKAGKLWFPWPDIRIWRDEAIRRIAMQSLKPTDEADAKLRKISAEAGMAELEFEKAKREVVPILEAEKWVAVAFARVRGKLLALPPRLAKAAVGHKTPKEAQAALAPLLYEAMEELRRADDVNDDDEADGDGVAA